jgi:translation initiation factor IF-1
VAGPTHRRKKRARTDFKEDMIYLEGVVTEALPGVRFNVKVERANGLEPLMIECNTKTLFKVKKIKIIKGDTVIVELDPTDLTKGTIVERK